MCPMTTELSNQHSQNIDTLSTREIVALMNAEDQLVAEAVAREAEPIAAAIDAIVDRLARGGRLLYMGAGTSGRLGVLDASECPPTFNTSPQMIIGIIAGGREALTNAIEGAEDNRDLAVQDLKHHQLSNRDCLVGIATSGRTPYVLAGLEHARRIGAVTIGLACNANASISTVADMMITPVVGPEVISGSTRLKAGTATKMVLNMLTTASMVRLGKTYGNLMVDLRATNSKLKERSVRIVQTITGLDTQQAVAALVAADGEVKTAIVTELCGVSCEEARQRLRQSQGHLRNALLK
jgi:N-acetylmuramic acid 6-phosphate etherase